VRAPDAYFVGGNPREEIGGMADFLVFAFLSVPSSRCQFLGAIRLGFFLKMLPSRQIVFRKC
jgi:hypothetical protein